jgi:translocation and assembly module TamA
LPISRIQRLASLVACLAPVVLAAATPGALAQGGIPYDVAIIGVDDDLRDLIEASSRLIEAENAPPAGLAGLNQRAENDLEDFQRVLRSEGYYGARIALDIDANERPAKVTITITPGQVFLLARCTITVAGDVPMELPRNCADVQTALGVPARASNVIEAEARLLRRYLERGFPDVTIARRAVVDHATHEMDLTYTVTPGEAVRLGEIAVSGTERTDPDFLVRLRTWEPGAQYDVRLIDAYRERLNGLDLFDSVIATPRVMDGELRTVELTVHERPPRTFGGGVRYATDTGFGFLGYWEHRNFRGSAERLRTDLGIAELAQSLIVNYSLPHRPGLDQRLDFTGMVLSEETEAYDRAGGEVSASLTMPLTRYWRAKFGTAFQAYDVRQAAETDGRTSLIASLPVDATYDGTDALLDPTEGERFVIRATPVAGSSNGSLFFLRLDGEAAGYLSFGETNRTVLAGRLRYGSILGTAIDQIPPDWRFYGGGGGSVRGYGYQRVGPMDAKDNPIGGRTIAEAAVELRQRVTDRFGAVAFVEAGSVGRTLTGFEDPRYGAGVGIRYYTAFGPIRADIATPLNPRASDASIQLYISIGQAF